METFVEYPCLVFPTRWKPHGEQSDAEKIYRIEEQEGNRLLHAHAQDKAIQIGLIRDFAPRQFPRLRWRWRVTQLPRDGDERRADTFDSAARVYVIFGKMMAYPRIPLSIALTQAAVKIHPVETFLQHD